MSPTDWTGRTSRRPLQPGRLVKGGHGGEQPARRLGGGGWRGRAVSCRLSFPGLKREHRVSFVIGAKAFMSQEGQSGCGRDRAGADRAGEAGCPRWPEVSCSLGLPLRTPSEPSHSPEPPGTWPPWPLLSTEHTASSRTRDWAPQAQGTLSATTQQGTRASLHQSTAAPLFHLSPLHHWMQGLKLVVEY